MSDRGRKRFAVVHGIPSPYRLHLFERMNAYLDDHGWRMEVHFMDECSGDRAHWRRNLDVSFAHRFWKNWKLPGSKGRFNPGLLNHLRDHDPEIVMLGGVWDSVTAMVAVSTLRRPVLVGWYEANVLIPGRMDVASASLKRYLLRRLDWHAIPGERARGFLRLLLGDEAGRLNVSELPNLIDEGRFNATDMLRRAGRQLRTELGVPLECRLVVTPARLIPKKGLLEFLEGFAQARAPNLHYLVLGEGPLLPEFEHTVRGLELMDRVSLVGFLPYHRMPEVYGMADVFCLPSVNDPNPLSPIEAMHTGLPLLISRRLGNFPEAMVEDQNGYSFDPMDGSSIVEALERIASADEHRLSQMGEASRQLAAERWGSDRAVARFLEPIIAGRR